MSKFFVGFLNADQLAAIHSAGHVVEAFALSEPAKLVATLATSSIGATVKAEITTLKDQSLSGSQKFTQALSIALPLVVKYATAPGTIVTDAEGIARSLVQELYNDVVGAVKTAVTPASTATIPAPPVDQTAVAQPIAA